MARGGRGSGGGSGGGGGGRGGRNGAKGPQAGARGGRGAGQQPHGAHGSKRGGGAQQARGPAATARPAKQQQQQQRPSPAAAAAAKKFMTGDFVMTIDDDDDVPAFDAADDVDGVDAPAPAKAPKGKRAKTEAAGGADAGGDIDPTFSFAADATLSVGWDLSSVLDRVAAKGTTRQVRRVGSRLLGRGDVDAADVRVTRFPLECRRRGSGPRWTTRSPA